MASLLRQQMRKELRRLDATDRDKAIRTALANKRRGLGPAGWDPVAHPCPWWSPSTEAEHRAWLAAPPPVAVPWEQLDPCKQWAAGQPVLLHTSGHEHVVFVRLEGFAFHPRWLRGAIGERRVSPAELATRDPREVWSDAFELQLAQALLSAPHDPNLAWLDGIDEGAEPELFDLLELAREELARRPAPTPGPAPTPSPAPKPRRGWTHAEMAALRLPEGVVEPVDLAPGR
jgi:hypothetical protein